jgi:hypothetical protein
MISNKTKASGPALPLTLVCAGAASAQNQTVTIHKDALQKVEPYHARRQIQIIDESPIVSDLRRAPQQPDQFNIQIGPGPAAQAPRIITIKAGGPGSLPFAGTTSNIPSGGMRAPGNLAPTHMGVLPKYAPPRAIGSSAPTHSLSNTTAIAKLATAPAEYARVPDRNLLTGAGGGNSVAQPTVRAQLLNHK